MDIVNSNMLIYIILAIIVILIVFSIIKKAVKLLILLIAIFFLFFAYNVFIKGASPVEEVKGYISDVKYAKEIAGYTSKIKASVDNIEKAISSKDKETDKLNILKDENTNLNRYYQEVKSLEHRERLNSFHDKYSSYVKNIADSTAMVYKAYSLTGDKNYKMAEDAIEKIKSNMVNLSKVKELMSTSIKKD